MKLLADLCITQHLSYPGNRLDATAEQFRTSSDHSIFQIDFFKKLVFHVIGLLYQQVLGQFKILAVLFATFLIFQPLHAITTYWTGKEFKTEKGIFSISQLELYKDVIQGQSFYFNPPHLACYGHAMLDGMIPLYRMLNELDLLDTPINLLVPASPYEENNTTFKNIIKLLRDIYPYSNVIIIPRGLLHFPIRVENLFVNEYIPLNKAPEVFLSFYEAVPESWKYIFDLKSLGFVDNISYKDSSIQSNVVKDFVDYVKKRYQLDDQLKKNRIIISYRATSRKILNLEELVDKLALSGFETLVVDFEKLSIKEQVRAAMQAEYIIGTYGSNITNAMFLNPQAAVLVLWHKYAKYFWSRRRCIIHSAFLSTGITLLEYDKPLYDPRDIYKEPIRVHEYFYKNNEKIFLRSEKLSMQDFINYPLLAMYELLNVDMYIDPEDIIQILRNHSALKG